jgi:GTP cyclohydrolase II
MVGWVPLAVIVGTRDFTNARSRAAAFRLPDWRLLGSGRCDCGEQLRLVLALLEDLGGGIILYLTREGRGLGLANKMRTYQLQNDGLDTFDANTTLGFDDDERDYDIVARMLRMLNCTRTVLLANDRAKHAARGAYQC